MVKLSTTVMISCKYIFWKTSIIWKDMLGLFIEKHIWNFIIDPGANASAGKNFLSQISAKVFKYLFHLVLRKSWKPDYVVSFAAKTFLIWARSSPKPAWDDVSELANKARFLLELHAGVESPHEPHRRQTSCILRGWRMTSRANVDPLQREKLSKNFFCCRLRKRKMKNCFSFVEEWLLEFFSGTLAFLKQHLSEVFGKNLFLNPPQMLKPCWKFSLFFG